jgi:O-antigen ligase
MKRRDDSLIVDSGNRIVEKNKSYVAGLISFWVLFGAMGISIVAGGLIWRGDIHVQEAALIYALPVVVIYLAWRGGIKKGRLPKVGVMWSLILAIVGLVALWLFSTDIRQGLGRVSWILTYLLVFYLFIDAFDSGLQMDSALHALLWITGIVLFLAVLEVYVMYSQWWQAVGSWRELPPFPYRLVSFVGHSNSFMGLLNLAAPLAVVCLVRSRTLWGKIGLSFWLVCYLAVVPFSSSRGGWIGLAAWAMGLAILWAVILRPFSSSQIKAFLKQLQRYRVWLVAGIPGVLALAGYAGYRFFIAFAAHPSHGSLFGGREEIWAQALRAWQSSPWVGVGPGRFGYAYLAATPGIPQAFWALHAHGMLISILTEFGVVGLIIFLLAAGFGAAWIIQRALQARPENRLLAIAGIAGLVGWLAQMVFDDQTAVPAVMIPLVFLLAWLAGQAPEPLPRFNRLSLSWLWLPAGLIATGALWSVWAAVPESQAVDLYGQQKYQQSANQMALSARLDPYLPYYAVESGLAWAKAWDTAHQPADLARARAEFQRSLALEPAPSWNWANLAVLDWQAGDRAVAIEHMEKAIVLSPSEAAYPLNLAWFYEQAGQVDLAAVQYRRSLDISPGWAGHPFWSLTPLRSRLLNEWKASQPEVASPGNMYWQQAGEAALHQDTVLVQRLLARSSWLAEPQSGILLVRAQVAEANHNGVEAAQDYESLIDVSFAARQGWYSNLSNTYSLWLYGRRGLPDILVPGFLLLEDNYGQYAAFNQLIDLYRTGGECAQAAKAWSKIQVLIRGGGLDPVPPAPACP